mgnify:CR=1 FL=1|jgi:hypothetical protein
MNFTYIDELIKNCQLAKETNPNQEFVLDNLCQLDNVLKAIYIIKEVKGSKGVTFDNFKKYKSKKERKCSRLNLPSSVLYVGSSTTGIRKRIRQHLGLGYKGTYSLHLGYWFTGEYEITIKTYNELIPINVLQIIEDNLSYQLKPAFGKQGGNNK